MRWRITKYLGFPLIVSFLAFYFYSASATTVEEKTFPCAIASCFVKVPHDYEFRLVDKGDYGMSVDIIAPQDRSDQQAGLHITDGIITNHPMLKYAVPNSMTKLVLTGCPWRPDRCILSKDRQYAGFFLSGNVGNGNAMRLTMHALTKSPAVLQKYENIVKSLRVTGRQSERH
jgi:hypothetical protein